MACLVNDSIATINSYACELRQYDDFLMQGYLIVCIMMGFAVDSLIPKLADAVIAGIIASEEVGANTIKLHQIANDMGADDHIGNASAEKQLLSLLQSLIIRTENDITLTLCSGIAALEPIAVVSCYGWHGNIVIPHQSV